MTFVCDIAEPLAVAPSIKDYHCALADPTTLEVMVDRGQSLNQVFLALSAKDVSVTSMRTKTNRLEELFISMTSEELT